MTTLKLSEFINNSIYTIKTSKKIIQDHVNLKNKKLGVSVYIPESFKKIIYVSAHSTSKPI